MRTKNGCPHFGDNSPIYQIYPYRLFPVDLAISESLLNQYTLTKLHHPHWVWCRFVLIQDAEAIKSQIFHLGFWIFSWSVLIRPGLHWVPLVVYKAARTPPARRPPPKQTHEARIVQKKSGDINIGMPLLTTPALHFCPNMVSLTSTVRSEIRRKSKNYDAPVGRNFSVPTSGNISPTKVSIQSNINFNEAL